MFCQKCQRSPSSGRPYIFYFGNQTGRERRGNQTITSYHFAGSLELFLCNECVFAFAMRERFIGFLTAAAFFFVVACIGFGVSFLLVGAVTGHLVRIGAGLVLAYAVSLLLTGIVEKKRSANNDFATLSPTTAEELGSKLAISLREADMKARGFLVLFTPERMKELRTR